MAEFVDSTIKEIDGRLQELRGEVSRLEAARSALAGERRRPGRPRGSSARAAGSTSRPTRGRARRRTTAASARTSTRRGGNTRANQALELVRKQPGVTIPELATAMKIQPNYLYRVLPRLAADGQVKREGQGWHATS